jgi:hypothetical protein
MTRRALSVCNWHLLKGTNTVVIKVLLVLTLALFALEAANAQTTVPILSGGLGFLGTTRGGVSSFQPVVAPVLVVPLGENFLIESRADLRGFISRENGTTGPYQGQFFATLEYLQIDFLATTHITMTVGRYLTPFGIYNERLSAIWIPKFQEPPIIAAIGTGTGYSDGYMFRGAMVSNDRYAVNYSAYFSTLSTVSKFESERATGGRVGLFLPRRRLELGTSYHRTLQGSQSNAFGVDLSWSPYTVPLQIKGEWAHSPGGNGYWIEAAYRLSQFHGPDSVLGRLEPAFRMQQFFRSKPIAGDSLPAGNAQFPETGLNYYLPHVIRLNASYTRECFSHSTNVNVWDFGITYRFLFPLWPGVSK